jgi:iron complex outermembrane recepter protein
MPVHRLLSSLSASLSVLCAIQAAPVWAQQPATPEATPMDIDFGGDIVITATRRASPLSDVPLAVSAVTAQSLRNSGANDIRQLNQLAPSLLVSSTGTEANGAARIRGIGTVGDNPGLESSVAVFIDGVYRSRTGAGLTDLGEIERVEVLRGPQGTLFGRNASAGILNIVSKAPSFKLGGSGEIGYGNYNGWRLAGRLTGPLSDTLAASIDGVWSKRDGFLTNVDAAGKQVGETNDRNRWFLRGQLLFEPSSDLTIRLIGDYSHRDETCCGAVYVDTSEETGASRAAAITSASNRIVTLLTALGTVFPNGATPYTQDPYNRKISITPGRDYMSSLRDWGFSGEIDYDLGSAKLTGITAYRDYKSADYGDYDYATADLLYRDPNTFRQFRTFTQELRLQGTAFGDGLDWLVGGYYAHEKLTLRDNIRFGADYGHYAACRLMQGAGNVSNFNSGTLTLCSPGVDSVIPNIGTLITLTEGNLQNGLYQALLNAGLPASAAGAQSASIARSLASGLLELATIPAGAGDTDSRYFQNSENWALFTHNIVHLAPGFDLTLGLRYTRESKNLRLALTNNNASCAALQANSLPGLAANASLGSAAQLAGGILTLACLGNSSTSLNALTPTHRQSEGQFSGTGVLSYKIEPGMMVYGSFSRGYKAGGYNLDRFELGITGVGTGVSPLTYFSPRANADIAALWFEPETVNGYEVGFKVNRQLWGINGALFREEFSNFQLNTFNGTTFVVQNINGCKSAKAANGTCASTKAGLISEGIELESHANPTRYLRLTSGVTYAKARFADRLVGNGSGSVPLDPALFLLEGNINSNAPLWVTTGSIAWTPPIAGTGLSALLYLDGRTSSRYNTGSDLYPEKVQDRYAVFNARIGLRGPDERWSIELWGQNIFNETFTQVTFNSPLQSSGPNNQSSAQLGRANAMLSNQLFSAYLGEPRTYGVTLRGNF